MNFLLSISRGIDAVQERFGRALMWLILAAVLVSSVNAIIRFALSRSSNAWLMEPGAMVSLKTITSGESGPALVPGYMSSTRGASESMLSPCTGKVDAVAAEALPPPAWQPAGP